MKIEQSQQGTVTVIAPIGAVIDEDRVQLEALLDEQMSRGRVKIVLDLNAVPFIESEGLEILLDASERAASKGGGIRIANPSDIVRDIMVATRLGNKIELHAELNEARRSLL